MTIIAVIVAALTVALVTRAGRAPGIAAAVLVAIVMVVEYALASSGVLHEWTRRPPPMLLAAAVPINLALAAALSPIGRRIAMSASFAAIIGIQAFRLPLELLMHRAATIGLMPEQMSYTGRNFDIVSGILAIVVAWMSLRSSRSRPAVLAWNIVGTVLLLNIVTVAIASLPVFAAFGPNRLNTWVAEPPYVFLPTVLVPAAVFGHALTWRKLALERSSANRLPHRDGALS
jgi:hypothetical protein